MSDTAMKALFAGLVVATSVAWVSVVNLLIGWSWGVPW